MKFDQNKFQSEYSITDEKLAEVSLSMDELKAIFEDFVTRKDEYERALMPLTSALQKIDCVHSVRTRVKDPYHLLDKIYRKRKDEPNKEITVATYRKDITDLAGLRALHLYKYQFVEIHNAIANEFNIFEDATLHYREGDNIDFYIQMIPGIIEKPRAGGYRSIHYVIRTAPQKEEIYSEIQVRTIFEEGWSEVDHLIRYPNNTDNPITNDLLLIFNRIAGMGDELAWYIERLHNNLQKYERIIEAQDDAYHAYEEQLSLVKELEEKMSQLSSQYDELSHENSKLQNEKKTIEKMQSYFQAEVSRLQEQLKIYNPLGHLQIDNQSSNLQGVLPYSESRMNIMLGASALENLRTFSSEKIKCKNILCQFEFVKKKSLVMEPCPKCGTLQ